VGARKAIPPLTPRRGVFTFRSYDCRDFKRGLCARLARHRPLLAAARTVLITNQAASA
jgi:hypothetical protein